MKLFKMSYRSLIAALQLLVASPEVDETKDHLQVLCENNSIVFTRSQDVIWINKPGISISISELSNLLSPDRNHVTIPITINFFGEHPGKIVKGVAGLYFFIEEADPFIIKNVDGIYMSNYTSEEDYRKSNIISFYKEGNLALSEYYKIRAEVSDGNKQSSGHVDVDMFSAM